MQQRQDRIPTHIWNYVDTELKNYQLTLKHIETLRNNIILAGCSEIINLETIQNEISRPTEGKAVKLVSMVSLIVAENIIMTIDRVCDSHPEAKMVYELHYQKCLTWQKAKADYNIERPTFFRWKRKLIEEVAKGLGMMV